MINDYSNYGNWYSIHVLISVNQAFKHDSQEQSEMLLVFRHNETKLKYTDGEFN